MKKISSPVRNQSGQTLIEYLIIVALVGVGSIALMRAVGQNINARFATVVHALGGTVEGDRSADKVSSSMYRKRDLKGFVSGAIGKKDGSENGRANDGSQPDSE